jgi:phosphate transport system ATP-binding protein
METKPVLKVKNFNVWYGSTHVLKTITLDIAPYKITAFIGPSGCGKSTLIRCFNRMNDFIPSFKAEGEMLFGDKNIYNDNSIDPIEIRLRIGMVFQKPNPFPKTIYENIAYGPKLYGIKDHQDLDNIVEENLKKAFLWDEVKDKLHQNALELSGGQQQRLCIARALAVEPEILLLDEPCSALDPISTYKVEELMKSLKERYTIILVTHNMQQAGRVSDFTAFLYLGELIEFGKTDELFTAPKQKLTENYISGRFG